MQKIIPHLWFNKEATEAAEFYMSLFPNTRFLDLTVLQDTPSGTVDMVTIELEGMQFMLLSAGPYFHFTPAVSFLIACTSIEEVDFLWKELGEAGRVLMELDSYPFSPRYGWLSDKFGVNWQIMLQKEGERKQKFTPTLMFVGDNCGRCEEAMGFYTSIFHDSSQRGILRYGDGLEYDLPGTIQHAEVTLEKIDFAAMDSAYDHDFTFNEAISFIVNCDTQEEMDYYWDKLSADPQAEQCGWLKDKYGVSWQISPIILNEMLKDENSQKRKKVMEAFLDMKKIDLSEIKKVYEEF